MNLQKLAADFSADVEKLDRKKSETKLGSLAYARLCTRTHERILKMIASITPFV